ncbi:hypothetical protein [Herbidospora sp. NBRC 101105]|nr:hypothetical protein [Herbidospora sp. NBRC 101105]
MDGIVAAWPRLEARRRGLSRRDPGTGPPGALNGLVRVAEGGLPALRA